MKDNFLPGIELSEKDLILLAQQMPLKEKIGKSLLLLKTWQQMIGEQYVVAFSGGKDSVVIKHLCVLAGVDFKSVYSQTTIDPPELVRFIQKHHPDVQWSRPKQNLIFDMKNGRKGPPTRINRWCCAKYKEQAGVEAFRVVGVRAEESPRRAKLWKEITIHNKNNSKIICPILYWTTKDVWEFISDFSLEYCELYDQGFDRLGCVGCPMSGRKGRLRDFKKWPGFERLWQRGFEEYYKMYSNDVKKDGTAGWLSKFKNWQEMWAWWMEDSVGDEEECQQQLLFV